MDDRLDSIDFSNVTVIRGGDQREEARAHGHFDVVCLDPEGNVKWVDEIENTVVNQGKDYMLNNSLSGSSFTTPGPYMTLCTSTGFNTTPAATNTYQSHPDYTETTRIAARLVMSFTASSSGTKTANAVSFSITGTDTIAGCAVMYTVTTTVGDNSAVSGLNNFLLSVGPFTGGNKSVGSGDTIQVTYSFSI